MEGVFARGALEREGRPPYGHPPPTRLWRVPSLSLSQRGEIGTGMPSVPRSPLMPRCLGSGRPRRVATDRCTRMSIGAPWSGAIERDDTLRACVLGGLSWGWRRSRLPATWPKRQGGGDLLREYLPVHLCPGRPAQEPRLEALSATGKGIAWAGEWPYGRVFVEVSSGSGARPSPATRPRRWPAGARALSQSLPGGERFGDGPLPRSPLQWDRVRCHYELHEQGRRTTIRRKCLASGSAEIFKGRPYGDGDPDSRGRGNDGYGRVLQRFPAGAGRDHPSHPPPTRLWRVPSLSLSQRERGLGMPSPRSPLRILVAGGAGAHEGRPYGRDRFPRTRE